MKRFYSILALGIGAAVLLTGGRLSADDSPADPNRPTQVKVTLHPQAVPRAALKYELLPRYLETTPGNAATLWYRAIIHMKAHSQLPDQQVYDLLDVDASQFSVQAAKAILARYQTALEAMRDAARRDHCDWELPLRTENPVSVLLPEMQDSRALGVLLALQARIQIHEGKYDEAIHTFQTGFALVRDVNQCPLIICNLISIAIGQILTNRVEEMLQRPDAPNLYWALTALPPLAPIDRAVNYEMSIPYQLFPFLRNPADAVRSDAEWQRLWDEAAIRLSTSIEGRPSSPWEMRVTMAANSIRLYPKAKELLKSRGLSPEQIEAMPVGQALAIYSAEILDEALGNSFKLANVPLWQQSQDDGIGELLRKRPEVLPIARNLLPAVRQFQSASQRLNRRIAELRALEAVRAAAAARDGQLPDSLALPETPVPRNPCTGADFGYMRNGQHAVLKADESPFSQPKLARVYDITLEPVK
jgi:hypothetical protein